MEIVKTINAPQAVGPYSQTVKANGFVFLSGQIPLKADGTFVQGDFKEQVTQVLENVKSLLEAAGSDLSKVVKSTVFLVDLNDFAVMNEVYSTYFMADSKPARSTIQVAALPKGAKVEIECIAVV